MTPTRKVNDIIGGVLARAVAKHDIRLFAFVFVSNHLHMLAAPKPGACPSVIADFMCYLKSNIARKLGKHLGWSEKFWGRRYTSAPVLEDCVEVAQEQEEVTSHEAFLERLAYILGHGVKEGLVAKCHHWPGLTSLHEHLGLAPRTFNWVNETVRYNANKVGRYAAPSEYLEQYTLVVTPPPCWAHLSVDERRAETQKICKAIEAEHAGRKVLGRKAILQQDPFSAPRTPRKRTPRPPCHAANKRTWLGYLLSYRCMAKAYRAASRALRDGQAHVTFPPHCFRPVLPRDWGPVEPAGMAAAAAAAVG